MGPAVWTAVHSTQYAAATDHARPLHTNITSPTLDPPPTLPPTTGYPLHAPKLRPLSPPQYKNLQHITPHTHTHTHAQSTHVTCTRAALVMPDLRTVYTTDDNPNGVLLKFVAARPGDLGAGALFAAKFSGQALDAAGRPSWNVTWVHLGNGA